MTAPTQDDPFNRVGTVLDGRFRLDQLLGAGAMGAVYVATAADGGRWAIKLLLNDTGSADFLGRFVREGRLTANLRAPNIARVHELAVDSALRVPFIVMELLQGHDVEKLIETVGPVHPTTAVRIALQAATGLSVAHAAGIVHRDVKPANIFLARGANGAVEVKVCDFGIAKTLLAGHEAMTATGSMLGSPLYMSPEQIRSSKHVDPRSDVWSLGMLLWTLLTGRSAFEHVSSLGELMVSITTKPVPWLQDFAPWIDPALARVVNGALLSDLAQRCPSMEAFVEGLTPFAGGRLTLTEADLVGAPPSMRQSTASRGAAAQSWSGSLPQDGASPPGVDASLQELIGHTLAGKYRLDRVLGSGGMGAVYEASSATGQRVAVKVLLGDAERQRPEVLRRFVREAKATLAVDSPHVVRILDVDADPERGLPFIVMELLSGTDLDKLVKQRGALEPAPIVKAFQQACAGLAAVHKCGIVHRDIKPANLFLHDAGGGTLALKICDFGIAKHDQASTDTDKTSTELTRTGGMLGSPMYMSPEQARSAKHVDYTSDIWGLGVALYEALSGRRPWEGCTTVGDLIIAICTQELPHLQEIAPWIEPGLADAVHHAVQRDPKARFASMEAFAAALAPFAGPPGPLVAASLVPVSAAVRARSAPRSGSFGSTNQGVTSGSIGTSTPPSRWRGIVLGLSVCVLAMMFAVGFLTWRTRKDRLAVATPALSVDMPKPEIVPATSTSVAAAPAVRTVAVSITAPTDAKLEVDGRLVAWKDGKVEVEGVVGSVHPVRITAGGRETRADVVIAETGPVPSRIELAPKATAGGTRPAHAGGAASTAGTQPTAKPTASQPTGAPTINRNF